MFLVKSGKRISRESAGWSSITCTKDRGGWMPYDRALARLEGGNGSVFVVRALGDKEGVAISRNESKHEEAVAAIIAILRAAAPTGRPTVDYIRGQIRGQASAVTEYLREMTEQGVLDYDPNSRKGVGRGPNFPEDDS